MNLSKLFFALILCFSAMNQVALAKNCTLAEPAFSTPDYLDFSNCGTNALDGSQFLDGPELAYNGHYFALQSSTEMARFICGTIGKNVGSITTLVPGPSTWVAQLSGGRFYYYLTDSHNPARPMIDSISCD